MTIGETVTILRQARTVDEYGNATSAGTPSRRDVVSLGFDPGGSIALRDGRDGTDTKPTVYLPTGTDIVHTDQLEVRGVTYAVEGEIADWRSPFTGARPGLVVPLRRVSG